MHREDDRREIDRRTFLARGAAFAALLVTGCAREEPRGFAAEGLRQLRSRLERHVEPGFAPGVVGLVAHGPDVETFVLGKMAFGDGADMRRDTIFRITSMTKAVTATAVMMLIEEGKFRLDEPVDRLLPELANRRVLRRLDAEVDDTVPARRLKIAVPVTRLHLVHVDGNGIARLKLRPQFKLNADQRVVRIKLAPVYDHPPTLEERLRTPNALSAADTLASLRSVTCPRLALNHRTAPVRTGLHPLETRDLSSRIDDDAVRSRPVVPSGAWPTNPQVAGPIPAGVSPTEGSVTHRCQTLPNSPAPGPPSVRRPGMPRCVREVDQDEAATADGRRARAPEVPDPSA
jgi:hypothetical protein